MRKLITCLICLFITQMALAGPIPAETSGVAPDEMVAYQPLVQPVIDGDLSEWIESGAMFKFMGTEADVMRGDWAGPDDHSTTWSVMWDADNLYFAAAVRDDVYTPAPSYTAAWRGDVMFMFMDSDPTDDVRMDNLFQVFLLDGEPAFRGLVGGLSEDANGVEVAIVRDPRLGDGGMFYEVSIPLANTNFNLEAGGIFGLTPGIDEGNQDPDKGKFYSWNGVDVDNDPIPAVTLGTIPTSESEGLVAYYAFENNLLDSSGNGLDGMIVGDPVFIADSVVGIALSLDGVDDYVDLPVGSAIGSLSDCTVSSWVNWSGQGGAWQRVFDFGSGTQINFFLTVGVGGSLVPRAAITVNGGGADNESRATAANSLTEGWHNMVVTIDSANMMIKLYIDGVVAGEGATLLVPKDLGETTQNYLGKAQYPDPLFTGSLDEFMIYDRALSGLEIAYLAGL